MLGLGLIKNIQTCIVTYISIKKEIHALPLVGIKVFFLHAYIHFKNKFYSTIIEKEKNQLPVSFIYLL